MFDNIGGKIKSLAQVICWIGIISSIISGFVMIATNEYLIFLGLVIMVIGSLISWVFSFTLYGFGQLIDNTDKLVHSKKIPTTNKATIHSKNQLNNKKLTINKNNAKQETLSKDFIEEINNTEIADLQLILEDQQDLYTPNEIAFIKNEISNRQD